MTSPQTSSTSAVSPAQSAPIASVVHAGEGDFQQTVIDSDKPVLVDFWAKWCGPCRALGPHLDRLADQQSDQLKVVKVDVDAEPALAKAYGIQAMPTLLVFRNGKEVARHVGAPRGRVALEKFALANG